MSTKNGLAVQVNEIRGILAERADTIMAAAAEHIHGPRLFETAARCCIANPQLLDCSRASIVSAVAEAANLGLELGGVLGQAYLVPFKGHAQLVPGYLGMKELAYRSGQVDVIDAEAVRPGDFFEYELGTDCRLRHRPSDEPSTQISHVYAIARTSRGGWLVRVMSKAQVERHRDKYAKGHRRKDSAWQTSFEAMAKKTVLRQIYKLLPLSSEVQTLVQREEYVEHGAPIDALPSGATAPADDLDNLASDDNGETQETAANQEREAATAGDEIPW